MCKTFPFFGSERGYEAIEKIAELHQDANKPSREVIAWFYGALTILDAKANSLLRVNSLFITFLVFVWGASRAEGNPLRITHDQIATAVLALIIVMASTIFCFLIVRVNWKFLGEVVKVRRTVNGQEAEAYDFQSEAKRLANIVDNRTHYYWIGWLLTLVVVLLPGLLWLQWLPAWLLEFLKARITAPG
jgi:hypothetical protein